MAKPTEATKSTAHQCVDAHALRALLEQLLREAKTPREFGERLRHTQVGQCARCGWALIELAMSRADQRRAHLSAFFARRPAREICEGLVGSSPQSWPPDERWPEVEAFALACDRRGGADAVLLRVLARLVSEAELGSERGRRAQRARSALRDCLRAQAEPAQLALAGLICDRDWIEAEAYRRQSFQDDASPEGSSGVWERAERALAPDEEPALESIQVPVGRRRPFPRKVTPKNAHRYAQAIETATTHLKDLEASAARLCAETRARGYAFAAVSIVRLEEGVIESIAGSGEAASWVGRARHPIHAHFPPEAQDIQAHVVLSGRAQLVFHDDKRLDPFLKGRFKHKLPRFFIPLTVAYDEKGHQINDACEWKAVRGTASSALQLITPEGAVVRVFGTIEVGIDQRSAQSLPRFIELANFVTKRAFSVYRCTLGRLFDTVVTVIRGLANASSATLHLGRKVGNEVRWYADHCFRRDALRAPCVLSPSGFAEGTVGGTPRSGGLGSEALALAKARTRCGEALRATNPAIFREGVRSMTAFPMFAGNEVALVYVHHREAVELDAQELSCINSVARRAAHSIRATTAYLEERHLRSHFHGQINTANDLFEAAQVAPTTVKKLVTGSLLNISAADFVMLYRVQDGHVDLTGVSSAGQMLSNRRHERLLVQLVQRVVGADEALFLGEDTLRALPSPPAEAFVNSALGRAAQFFEHEKVRSLAVLPLQSGGDLSAVLLVAWRRPVDLKLFEQRHLEFINSTVQLALEQAEIPRGGDSIADAAATLSTLKKVISSFGPTLSNAVFDKKAWKSAIYDGPGI